MSTQELVLDKKNEIYQWLNDNEGNADFTEDQMDMIAFIVNGIEDYEDVVFEIKEDIHGNPYAVIEMDNVLIQVKQRG